MGRPTRARVSDKACGQDLAAVPLARGRPLLDRKTGRPGEGAARGVRCGLSSRGSTLSLATGSHSPSDKLGPRYGEGSEPPSGIGRARALVPSVEAGGAISSQGHARERVISCRPPEGVVVQQRRGLPAWDWRTRLGTEQRTDAAARDARRGCCSVPTRSDGRPGVGSPLPRPTADGHRGAGAGPRVTADKERPVGQSAASGPRTGRRRDVTTVSVRRMSRSFVVV